jgi:hypothetical protein
MSSPSLPAHRCLRIPILVFYAVSMVSMETRLPVIVEFGFLTEVTQKVASRVRPELAEASKTRTASIFRVEA